MLKTLRLTRALALLLVLPIAAACGDDPTDDDDEISKLIHTVKINVGGQTIFVVTSTVTGGPIALDVGTTALTVQFLDRDGLILNVDDDDFEVRVTPGVTGVTFTRSGAFAGNLIAAQAGVVGTIRFELFHLGENHAEWGPLDLAATVNSGVE